MTSLRPITPEQHGEVFVEDVATLVWALTAFRREMAQLSASGLISKKMLMLDGPVGHAVLRVSQHLDARKGRG